MENKSIIYYKSNTGFSKMYAEILKPKIEATLILDIKNIKKKDILNYKNIIFIGPLRNNNILGLKKFLKKYKSMKNKNIFVLAVGMEQETLEKREIVINMNRLHKYHLRLYFLMGGFNFNKFSNFKKRIFNLYLKTQSNDSSLLSNLKNQAIDFVNSDNLDKMVSVFNKIN